MVCGVFDTTPEDDTITAEAFNPGKIVGNGDEVASNTDTRSGVGSPIDPHATTESMLRDEEFEAG